MLFSRRSSRITLTYSLMIAFKYMFKFAKKTLSLISGKYINQIRRVTIADSANDDGFWQVIQVYCLMWLFMFKFIHFTQIEYIDFYEVYISITINIPCKFRGIFNMQLKLVVLNCILGNMFVRHRNMKSPTHKIPLPS